MNIDLKHFKNILDKERKVLIDELKDLGIMNPKTGSWEAIPNPEEMSVSEADENDMADRGEDFQERTSTLNTLQKRLQEVDKAIQKINEKKYGRCEIGGEEIENERLEANPAATTCKNHLG
jgi:RNA polymerase-binding transcription factor DksA